jgi:transcriptional regulator with PAS, ATPase and Fis domain
VPPYVLLGVNHSVRALLDDAEAIAPTDAKVLITGESGVGKEVLAGFIHRRSRRGAHPMITINCAGVPESLLESELFGHERGSFTGAHHTRRGLLESAHASTILLDEVGEMSLRMQGILLRFLENGEIQRVGSDAPRSHADVRVIAATNRSLYDAVQKKLFREDLFYRLNIVHLVIPPLRERREDIRPFFLHFLQELSEAMHLAPPEITTDAWQVIDDYDWPGNVRQLRNAVERLLVTRSGQRVAACDLALPAIVPRANAATAASVAPSTVYFERIVNGGESFWTVVYEPFMARDLTRETVRAVVRSGLEHCKGNYRLVAQLFNLQPHEYKRFLNVLQKYDCHMPFQHFRTASAQLRPPASSQALSA